MTQNKFNWEDADINKLKPYLKNSLFEGIIGRQEFIILVEADVIDKNNTVLIAIHDPDTESHSSEYLVGFQDVLEIKFWDVEETIGSYNPINMLQGKLIREFIMKNKHSKFLVHCYAGMSRSAGVACAVECLLNYGGDIYNYSASTSEVKNFDRYHPNYKVFDAIMGRDN